MIDFDRGLQDPDHPSDRGHHPMGDITGLSLFDWGDSTGVSRALPAC